MFIPAHQDKFYKKAIQFTPSVFVPDMEDSVPGNEKDNARAMCKERIQFLHSHKPTVKIIPRPNELVEYHR